MPAGRIINARREREAHFPSCTYTPTAICLYPNDFAPIPNLKRTSETAFLFKRAKRRQRLGSDEARSSNEGRLVPASMQQKHTPICSRNKKRIPPSPGGIFFLSCIYLP